MTRLPLACGLVLLLACTGPALADDPSEFGRLFHSPEERLRLDREGTLEAPPAPVQLETRTHRLDGIVRRSDGRATVWIDGRAASGAEATPSADARGATIALPDGQQRRLRVGESVATEEPR